MSQDFGESDTVERGVVNEAGSTFLERFIGHVGNVSAPDVAMTRQWAKFTVVKSFLLAVAAIISVLVVFSLITAVTSVVWFLVKLVIAVAVVFFAVAYFVKK